MHARTLFWLSALVTAELFLGVRNLPAQERAAAGTRLVAPDTLTSFEQVWRLSDAEQRRWHRVRLDYVVYYYDPLWSAMWGRCGETDSYLSIGTRVFPVQPGQRILVEGLMQPSQGMAVEEPKVTVLAASVPLEPLSTVGHIGDFERFNKRLVVVEGYVDRQVGRDANHLVLDLVAEGRMLACQLLLRSDQTIPQWRDSMVRAKGVYFVRSQEGGEPKIELWVQRQEDVEVLTSLSRDPRFDLPPTPISKLSEVPAGAVARIAGTVQAQQPGRSLVVRDETGSVEVRTPQGRTVHSGDAVNVIGYPAREGDAWVLQQAIFRNAGALLTSVAQLWQLPDDDKLIRHRVKLEFLVYYYDPQWHVNWGRSDGTDNFFALVGGPFAIRPGQRILVEGSVLPTNGLTFEDVKITVLAENEPLEALATTGRIRDTARFNKHLVQVEGLVDRQPAPKDSHLELDLVVEGRPVIGRLLLEPGATPPDLEGSLVRLQGVYSATPDPAGAAPTIEVWSPGLQHLEVLGWLDRDERFNRPVTPVERLPLARSDALVRVAGLVRAQQAGQSVTLRDDTGQVVVETAQTSPLHIGEPIEVIGLATPRGADWIVRQGLYRRIATGPGAPALGTPTVRLAEQLRDLSPEEAGRSHPVRLAGVVTWFHPNADFFYLQDASGGVCVIRPADFTGPILVGTRVDVTGVSTSGRFTPEVVATKVVRFATVEPPEARTVTLEQALTGIEEGHWVRMSGYVREVMREGPWMRVGLTTAAGDFVAYVPPDDDLPKLRGSVVQVRGVCSALTNSRRQLTGIRLWVPGASYFEIEEPVPPDPFAVPQRTIASLRQFSSRQTFNHRVRVSGVVLHQTAGRLVHLQEGSEALLVLSRDTSPPLNPGDRIEAVGFPGRENNRLVLREAVYRRVAAGPEPAPLPLERLHPVDADLDGRLVRIEGVLLDVGAQEDRVRLILQADTLILEAHLDAPREDLPAGCVSGSRAALTGVYLVQFDEYRRVDAVRLQLRTAGDVRVLRRAPWWTGRHVLSLIGLLATGLVLGFAWVFVLRRRVRKQTGQIREQLEKEKAARLEVDLMRTSKLESLGILAGGIAHDFNNLLTVVMGNLSLAKLDGRCEPETRRCLTEGERAVVRARDLTQQLLTFARGGDPVRTATDLPEIVREATRFALHGSKVSCEFDIADDLWSADVDRGQIAQVVQNIIINADHAMPVGGVIRITLRNDEVGAEGRPGLAPGRYVRLSVADTGTGIAPENLARIFDPYFTTKENGTGLGLTTTFSIVRKHQGHIEVESKLGQGSVFHVWLPAAKGPPASSQPAVPAAPSRPPWAARVLFMDDEAQIREVAVGMLQRLGHDVTAVDDGSAAVIEYAAARDSGRPYDLVILDLTVPGGMGGAKALEKLRQMDPQVRAVVSSGYSKDPVLANYRRYGFRAIVPKPYELKELADTIAALLREDLA